MNTWIEITKEAFDTLKGNDEKSWQDYKKEEHAERSFYLNAGVRLQSVCSFLTGTTQYYIQDINA